MRTPKFWFQRNSLLSLFLSPLGEIYNFFTQRRVNVKNPYLPNIPVICVGNITAGGNGKTPTAMAIAKRLQKEKKKVCFISKGYKASIDKKYPIIVNSKSHSASEVGDEPLLLSQVAPCIICDSRERALIFAENLQLDVIIMDDGFQDGSVARSCNLLVIDATKGFGNGRCIPAGPCREKIEVALMRAHACVLIGNDLYNLEEFIGQFIPVLKASLKPKKFNSKKEIFAFAGIGNPNKFYESLREIGFKNFETRDFDDHHFYEEKELNSLPKNKQLVTTSKDFVKLPKNFQKLVKVLEVELKFEDEKKLKEVLK